MRIQILAIGRARKGPEQDLYRANLARLPWPVSLKELELRKPLPAPERIAREGELLLEALPKGARLVALDERGKSLDSAGFAARLQKWADAGEADICFVIGGADGLSEPLRKRADLLLSLGAMTWPHLLVRALLAEQLYRAWSIIAGHPYHRS